MSATMPGSGRCSPRHYAGDDTNLPALAGGILAAFDGISVEDFEAKSDDFLRSAQHPTLGRGYLQCAYAPMVELLRYLKANGFSNYIASGGGRDFMRPISHERVWDPTGRGDRKRDHVQIHQQRSRRHDHPPSRSRLSRRRPAEADPHLEPHSIRARRTSQPRSRSTSEIASATFRLCCVYVK